jgi:predicted metalloprotease
MGFPMPGGGGGFPIKAGGGILGIVVALAAVFLPQLLGGASAPTMGVGAPELPAAADGRQQGAGEEGTVLCTTEIEQVVCGATDDIHLFWEGAFPQQFQQE